MICELRLQQIAHTVKFIKLANIITLKRSLIAQNQKLVTAYTRPAYTRPQDQHTQDQKTSIHKTSIHKTSIHKTQVRIVSFNFSDNCNIKRNTAMNVNRSQKHGPILHYITEAKSRNTKITVMHHTLTHFNSKCVKNPYFCISF